VTKNQSEISRLLTGLFEDLQQGVILWQVVVITLLRRDFRIAGTVQTAVLSTQEPDK
jgi:hypothetical protein